MRLHLLLSCAVVSATGLSAAESRLTNVSVRSAAGTDAQTLIVGFAIGGTTTRQILVRGIGPSLIPFGVAGAVTDSQLRLYAGGSAIADNDDWGGDTTLRNTFAAVGAFSLAANSRDAVLLRTLSPGAYSAHLLAASGPGIALVECYDADPGATDARITNVSARSLTGTGADVLTVGFSITGTEPKTMLVRGVGPALTAFGVTDAIVDPRLKLFTSAGIKIGDNDDWITAVSPSVVFSLAGAFALPGASRDAVLLLGLPPGTYTAQITNDAGQSGTALIEVYETGALPVNVVTLQPVTSAALPAPVDAGVGTATTAGTALPQARSQVRPSYPFELRLASVTGEVLVDFYVKTDGTVGNAVAIRATDQRFAAAAVTAVERWLFVPARQNGRLVVTHMQVPIIFTLDDA